jgi:hypothetical protein
VKLPKIPSPTHAEVNDLFIVVSAMFLAALLLPLPNAILATATIPALWLWFCSKRRKWNGPGIENPPTWPQHLNRTRDEGQLFVGVAFLVGTVTAGHGPAAMALGIFAVALVHLARFRHRFRRQLAASATALDERLEAIDRREAERQAALVRPTHGTITRRLTGEVIEVRWIESGEPGSNTFIPVTVDGEPVLGEPGDSFTADVIGPQQSIAIPMRPPGDDQ